jgi:aminotransferase in exopolysaccharide biosynthesis
MDKYLIDFFRETFQTNEYIPLHAPVFNGNEQSYVNNTITSTFVSSVGHYVNQLESEFSQYVQVSGAVATVNGSSALYTSLYLCGITKGDLVITQALTFVATCNAISQLGGQPLFIDVSAKTLGLCPIALADYLNEFAILNKQGQCIHRITKQKIKAVIPMHTFGHPCEINQISRLCDIWNLQLVEDAAESLGSLYDGQHTGTFGRFGIYSFNGNKIITTGGGGMIVAKNKADAQHAKHVTTTAKSPHKYDYYHDEHGFNFRMPNINAALGCAQLEKISEKIKQKRKLAQHYQEHFVDSDLSFVTEPAKTQSNYWLNALICPSLEFRDSLLHYTNTRGVMTRPAWTLMHKLPMYKNALRDTLKTSLWLESCLINIPSSPIDLK